jgi:hypothetical protein
VYGTSSFSARKGKKTLNKYVSTIRVRNIRNMKERKKKEEEGK